jgi:hypothetical protein
MAIQCMATAESIAFTGVTGKAIDQEKRRSRWRWRNEKEIGIGSHAFAVCFSAWHV